MLKYLSPSALRCLTRAMNAFLYLSWVSIATILCHVVLQQCMLKLNVHKGHHTRQKVIIVMVNVQMLQLFLVRAPGPCTVATPMPSTCTASASENHSISYMYFKLKPWIHILEFLYSANFRKHPLDVNIESKSPNNKAICEPWPVQHAANNTPLYISMHPQICQHMLVLQSC